MDRSLLAELCTDIPGCIEESTSWVQSIPLAVNILIVTGLVCMSALFSGLTLGLLSLDTVDLQVSGPGRGPCPQKRREGAAPVGHWVGPPGPSLPPLSERRIPGDVAASPVPSRLIMLLRGEIPTPPRLGPAGDRAGPGLHLGPSAAPARRSPPRRARHERPPGRAPQILKDVGSPDDQRYATAILPIRQKGNLLLCTLLVGNSCVNSFMSIFLADLTSGAVGVALSTMLIVIFGEISPQSFCTRHGLMVGAKTAFITRFFMTVFYPITWPISKVLDYVLGQEVGTTYNRHELKRLIELHAEHPDSLAEQGITKEEGNLISGALEYAHKKVADVMTHVENVYMVDASTKLDFSTMLEIYKCGYTRIPVYEDYKQNVVGILYVKDLILVDPDDEIEVRTIISFNGRANVRFVLDTTPLNEVMSLFQKSHIHLMIAVRIVTTFDEINGLDLASLKNSAVFTDIPQATRRMTGIITLEDVLEEVIKAEIVDEHDTFVANNMGAKVQNTRGDVSKFLELFSHKMRENSKLTTQEIQAVCAYVTSAVPEFKPLKGFEAVVKGLIRSANVVEIDGSKQRLSRSGVEEEEGPTEVGQVVDHSIMLYKRGVASEVFTLVLQGEIMVEAGEEAFDSVRGPWQYLGSSALRPTKYIPDYTALAHGPVRLVQISRTEFAAALKAGQVQTVVGARTIKKIASGVPLGGTAPAGGGARAASRGASREGLDAPAVHARLSPVPASRSEEQLGDAAREGTAPATYAEAVGLGRQASGSASADDFSVEMVSVTSGNARADAGARHPSDVTESVPGSERGATAPHDLEENLQ